MMKRVVQVVTVSGAMVLLAGGSLGKNAEAEGIKAPCTDGNLFSPVHDRCMPVQDKRHDVRQEKKVKPPDLAEMRKNKRAKKGLSIEGQPTPGGFGAGIGYYEGALQALSHAELATQMFVRPDGLRPSSPLSNLYTTATNRTEKTIEFLGWYSDQIPDSGYLWLWDWSCSADYPCQNSSVQPGFILGWLTAGTSMCEISEKIDKGGHLQKYVYYNNVSRKLDDEAIPAWSNELYLWNFCGNVWDQIYSHQFRAIQKDCSLDENNCGWWGPILETFDDVEPQIRELGFDNTTLYHDGEHSALPANEAYFGGPTYPWALYHLEPNNGYGLGNFVTFTPAYTFAGFLQPSSSGKAMYGRVLPVKFQLKDSTGNSVANVAATLELQKYVANAPEESSKMIAATSTGGSNTGNVFRYDDKAGQYIYNLDTRELAPGRWQLTVAVEGEGTHSIFVELR
jgi:hypothetical protein